MMTTMSSDGWRWEPGGCRVTELGGLLATRWLLLRVAGFARDCRVPLDWIGCHRPLAPTGGRLTLGFLGASEHGTGNRHPPPIVFPSFPSSQSTVPSSPFPLLSCPQIRRNREPLPDTRRLICLADIVVFVHQGGKLGLQVGPVYSSCGCCFDSYISSSLSRRC